MSATAVEKAQRYSDDGQHIRFYGVMSAADEAECRTAVLAIAPATYDPYGMSVTFWVRQQPTVKELGGNVWEASVLWKNVPATGGTKRSGTTKGRTARIQQALSQTKYPSTAPDLKGNINDDGDKVDGVEVIIPSMQKNITRYVSNADFNSTYENLLADLTGSTNDGAFLGRGIGEVLFLGADYVQRVQGDWEVSLAFDVFPSLTGQSYGDGAITGVSIGGHQYVSFKYDTGTVGTGANKRVVQKLLGVYVNTVSPAGNLSALGV